MTKIYLYAIINSGNEIDSSISGIDGESLYCVYYKGIGAVVSDFIDQLQRVTQNHILEHERVVEKLMGDFTVLPARFFSVFDKEENIITVLKEHYANFIDNLDRVKGKVEFGLKVIWGGNRIKEHIVKGSNRYIVAAYNRIISPGKSYMLEKAIIEKADEYIESIDAAFFEIATEKRLEKLKSEKLLLSGAYLVEREKVGKFKETFERLRTNSTELKFLFSGPWPPYNFIRMP